MKPTLALLALIACSNQPVEGTHETAQPAAPPPPTLTLNGAYLLRGVPVDVRVSGAPANATVGLAGSTTFGGPGSCPPQIAPLCLDIANPIRLLGTTRASGAGRASFRVTIPPTLMLPGVRLQAVAPDAQQVSNVGQMRILDPALDEDGDGLTNGAEHNVGLNPLAADTDDDGLDDGLEVALGTDPADADTDGGGAEDGAEVDLGLDPQDPADDACAAGGCDVDCAGVLGGLAEVDACGVCDANPANDCCARPQDQVDADLDGQIACFDCDDTRAAVGPGFPELCDGLDNDCDGAPGPFEGDLDLDGSLTCDDCDDADPARFPGAPERCNMVDDDCDGALPLTELDGDADGSIACLDCDDANPGRSPGQPERCDAIDNDCDGQFASFEADVDLDGAMLCIDCDDNDPRRYVGKPELCDAVDNDCDGLLASFEADADLDGAMRCIDCDDLNPNRYVGKPELCDAIDNDCDGALPANERDVDVDSVIACLDCDDNNPFRGPNFTEVCDGIDNDCDGAPLAIENDNDGDGSSACFDCDDGNPTRYPGAPELCDGLDNNCDGALPPSELDVDSDGQIACFDCDDTNASRRTGMPETCDGVDNDCDPATTASMPGIIRKTRMFAPRLAQPYGVWPSTLDDSITLPPGVIHDIDLFLSYNHNSYVDTDVWLFPPNGPGVLLANDEGGFVAALFDDDAPRWVHDAVGNIISRIRPETPLAPVVGQQAGGAWRLHIADGPHPDIGFLNVWRLDVDMELTGYETDADGDGVYACANDCDDSRAEVGPGKPELCDGVDNDCDGIVPANELDVDGDNVQICGSDCDDLNPEIRPGGFEVCNGVDDDCSGAPSALNEVDGDGDGVYVCQGDCNDLRNDIYPGAPEQCDRADSNCDGTIPGNEYDLDGDGWTECGGDCGPREPRAFPASPHQSDASFTYNNGQTSWDYNCDAVHTRVWTTIGAPCGGAFWICSYTDGWAFNVPDCGERQLYYASCPPDLFCSVGSEEQRWQACR